MWCYQKPGFEALLLTELQKQQQCSQFCDTLLKAEGVSVPAHSCILSAISPQFSTALSTPPLPAGQSHLLEFQALSACTLLHMVKLLYSGEMVGEGEREKQEAISAAAKLGIHGLVEVTKREWKQRNGEGQYAEVGVQTEPEESMEKCGQWRREMKDGSIFLWRETSSDGGLDVWTQTEELQMNTAPPPQPAVSFETINMGTLQSLDQMNSHLVPSEIIPISLIYPPDENQTTQPSYVSSASVQESSAATSTSVTVVPFTSVPLCAADLQSWWAAPPAPGRDVTVVEEGEDEHLKHFQGNITGFIDYFLDPDRERCSCRRRAGRRRGAGVGGYRRGGTDGRRPRGRPRGRPAGKGRGVLTQTVDVQRVVVLGRLQKQFLHRSVVRTPRTGQGGGVAGRKLHVKTREDLNLATGRQRRRVHGKVWELSQSGDLLLSSKGGGGGSSGQRGRKITTQQKNQDGAPVGKAQRSRDKSPSSASFSVPLMQFSTDGLPTSSPTPHHSPSLSLLPPAASCVPPAASFLHTSSLPSPPSLPHEDQPEHISHLLEEVMMGLDILPNSSSTPHPQCPLPTSSSTSTFTSPGDTLAQNKQQCHIADLHRSPQVVVVVRGAACSTSADGEEPVLQQEHEEGEMNKILDQFLQSFERHVESGREEREMFAESSIEASEAYAVLSKYPKTHSPHLQNAQAPHPQATEQQSDETPQSSSQPHNASAHCGVSPEHMKERAARPIKKTPKPVKVRMPATNADTIKVISDRGDKQLQQIPVVKLQRESLLPAGVTLQGHSCQSLKDKGHVRTKSSSSAVKNSADTSSGHNQLFRDNRTYSLRSWFKRTHVFDSVPFPEEPPKKKQPPLADQPRRPRGRPRKNAHVDPRGTSEKLKENQGSHSKDSTIQSQEQAEEPTIRGKKRGAKSIQDTSGIKRVCFDQTTQTTCGTYTPSFKTADLLSGPEDVINVETVSLSTIKDCSQQEQKGRPTWCEIKLGDSQKNKEADEDKSRKTQSLLGSDDNEPTASPSSPVHTLTLVSAGSSQEDQEEDIDVIGASSPIPDPVIISWTESSENEEEEGDEDVDVVEEKTHCASSAVLTAVINGELIRKYQTEMLLR